MKLRGVTSEDSHFGTAKYPSATCKVQQTAHQDSRLHNNDRVIYIYHTWFVREGNRMVFWRAKSANMSQFTILATDL